jgi:hypothetical protein
MKAYKLFQCTFFVQAAPAPEDLHHDPKSTGRRRTVQVQSGVAVGGTAVILEYLVTEVLGLAAKEKRIKRVLTAPTPAGGHQVGPDRRFHGDFGPHPLR